MPKSSRSLKTKNHIFPLKTKLQSKKGPGIADSMKQGFGLGVGLEGARAAMTAASGLFAGNNENSSQKNQEEINSTTEFQEKNEKIQNEICSFEKSVFQKCISDKKDLSINCEDYFKMWEDCYRKTQ